MKYIVIVVIGHQNTGHTFDTEQARRLFIQETKKNHPQASFACSEIPVKGEK